MAGGLRIWLERVAQGLALAIVVWLLVQSLRRGEGDATEAAEVRALPAALARWSTSASPARVHVTVDSALSPAQRAWLGALGGAGTRVTWEGDGVVPVAAVADAVADPAGGTLIRAAAPRGTTIVLEDELGVLDSVEAGSAGASFLARSAPAAVRLRAGSFDARSAIRDSLSLGRILLLGSVGWEAKFVTAALEERGWTVDARLTLSPKGDVEQGRATPIDTSRYAAVIALDSTALASAARIARYVRDGGGLVVAARTSEAAGLASLRAGALASGVEAVEPFEADAPEPRRALALTPIVLRPDAVALERRDEQVAVAVRRVARGRVAVVGYDDTWRWRLGGGADALEEHRAWWAGVVASVAHAGHAPVASMTAIDEAPLALLLDALGAASAAPDEIVRTGGIPRGWLLALFAVALLAAWLSRRLRGAP